MQNNTTTIPLNQNKMKQTAVEWLIKQLELEYNSFPLLNAEACIKAKEMEKDQILDAWKEGYDLAINGERIPKL